MKRIISWIAIVLLFPGCASELVIEKDGALTVIAHETSESGHITVETMLNGQGPFQFALDTGASISVIFDKTRAKAGLEPLPGKQLHVLGMTGSGHFPLCQVDQVGIGSEFWNDARVALLPDDVPLASRIDGVLGVDFLSRYAIVYSQEERVIRLYPKQLVRERSYAGWSSIPLFDMPVADGNLTMFAFDMFIDGKRIPAIFDLGASMDVLNRSAARSLNIRPNPPRKNTDVWGAFGEAAPTIEFIAWRVKVGNEYWSRREFLIGDLPVFDALDLVTKPVAIVGTRLFKERDFIIDFARMRLLVKRPE